MNSFCFAFRYMVDRPSAEKVDPRIQDGLFLMVVSNSCLNPLVYGAFTRECRDSMRNCCGFYNGSRREGPGRRNQFGRRPGPGDLRRQSQLKILNTSAKRPTSKTRLQSQSLKTFRHNPLTQPPNDGAQNPPNACKLIPILN